MKSHFTSFLTRQMDIKTRMKPGLGPEFKSQYHKKANKNAGPKSKLTVTPLLEISISGPGPPGQENGGHRALRPLRRL
jgi:hypothetical protein